MEEKKSINDINAVLYDIRNKGYTSKECYKAQLRIRESLQQTLTIVNLERKLQNETTQILEERTLNTVANYYSLLDMESTNKKANSTMAYSLYFLNGMYKESRKQMENNIKAYNEHWVQLKEKMESLPLVKILLISQTTKKKLLGDLQSHKKRNSSLKDSIRSKKILLHKNDQEIIINIAEFVTHVQPKILHSNNITRGKIGNLDAMINKIKEISDSSSGNSCKQLTHENVCNLQENRIQDFKWSTTTNFEKKIKDELSKLSASVPKLDVEQEVKSHSVLNSFKNIIQMTKPEEHTMTKDDWNSYFAFRYLLDPKQSNNLSDEIPSEKQIYLIDDKHINEKEAQSMLSSVDPNTLKSVSTIGSNSKMTIFPTDRPIAYRQMDAEDIYKPMEITEIIEPVDQQLVTPPTPFIDQTATEEKKRQQEKTYKEAPIPLHLNVEGRLKKSNNRKRVAFDIPEERERDDVGSEIMSPVSIAGEDVTKTDHFKKYKLDASLHFTYAKNNLLKKTDDKHIESKFFSSSKSLYENDGEEEEDCQNKVYEPKHNITNQLLTGKKEGTLIIDVPNEAEQTKASVSYGAQQPFSYKNDFPSSFDATFSTTTTDDDHEYQPCIDASLLLSPKGDIPEDNDKQNTEEIPNFLSGIKTKRLPFFGNVGAEPISDSNQNSQTKDSFNFNFGANKPKGGFFNIFR